MNRTGKGLYIIIFFIGCMLYAPPSFGQVCCGDANGSGAAEIVDALVVAQYYVGLPVPGFDAWAADVNCSGTIDVVDALMIARYYVMLLNQLGCCATPAPQAQDDDPPVITRFLIESTTHTSNPVIPVILEGADNIGITGWMITLTPVQPLPDDSGWLETKPTHYTLPEISGTYTLYAWAKDRASHVSEGCPGLLLDVPIVAISGGLACTVVLKADGTVAAWGDNIYGQCAVPKGLDNVKAVSTGLLHVMALKDDGTVVCWGDNRFQ
jgi:hypothetical protein